MAEVTSVTLHDPVVDGAAAVVSVEYEVTFAPQELNVPHQVRIELWTEDVGGQPNGFTPPLVFAYPRYTFHYGHPWLAPRVEERTIVPTAGTFRETVTNVVPRLVLDEDAAHVREVMGFRIPEPQEDELFARVTVSRPAVGTSPVRTFLF